jgi:hypothetical protein
VSGAVSLNKKNKSSVRQAARNDKLRKYSLVSEFYIALAKCIARFGWFLKKVSAIILIITQNNSKIELKFIAVLDVDLISYTIKFTLLHLHVIVIITGAYAEEIN